MRYAGWIALLLVFLAASPVSGQVRLQVPPTVQQADISAASIQSRLDALGTAEDLDETARNETRETLTRALEQARRAETLAAEAMRFKELAATASEQLAAIRAEPDAATGKPAIDPPADTTLQQLEQSLAEAVSSLAASRQVLSELQAEASRRLERRAAIPDQLAALRKKLADTQSEPAVVARENEQQASLEARMLLRQATELAVRREIETLNAEVASYDARRDLLPARRDQAQRRVSDAEALVAAWQNAVKERREADAQAAAQEALRQRNVAASQHPVLQAYATETAERAAARVSKQGGTTQIDDAMSEASSVRANMAKWRSEFTTIRRRLDAAGLNRATGLQLRRQYDTLPEINDLRRRVRLSQRQLEDAEYRLIDLQEERAETGDIDGVVRELLSQIPPEEMPADTAQIESEARKHVIARRDLLDMLVADASAYFDAAVELNGALHEKLTLTRQYRSFIEERIFWVRSIAGDRMLRIGETKNAIVWLLGPSAWLGSLSAIKSDTAQNWPIVSGVLLLVMMIWLPQVRIRRRLRHLGDMVSRYNTDAYIHTLEALVWTTVAALPLPATLWAIGWLLGRPIDQTEVATAVGLGLQNGALLLYPLTLLRQTLRGRGLAEAHFRWPSQAVASLKRHLHWLTPVVVISEVLVTAFENAGTDAYNASIGRFAFTAGLVALSAFLRRVLRPHGSVLSRFIEDNKGGLIARLRFIWYPLAFLLPLTFAVLSWTGFHYTAVQLETKLEHSLILSMVLVILNGVMLRWLFIARRRVAVEDARRKREQAAAEAQAKHESGSEPQAEAPPIDEDKVDLPALSQQTRQLFRAASTVTVVLGLYLIWAQALPALRMLDRVQLLPEVRITDSPPRNIDELTTPESSSHGMSGSGGSSGSDADGAGLMPGLTSQLSAGGEATAASEGESIDDLSITLADLGLAIVVLVATWAAFRNVPGLVEIVVLQHLPLDSGSRYALSTVMRYVITIIGVLVAAGTMGLAWSNVQWLAAALTFGLAFGLQEIFANFVSGLIILAERPVRLGDTVAVNGVTGTVTRIRMRATTITDWERKELIIPNKTFITSDVINWTLSDSTLRITIPVGVSYESDVDKVEKILHRIAAENRVVLQDPKPQVLFKSFGDSTLDYELRVFIPSIDHYVSIRHELHTTVIKEFRKAGIEIAFPQRDLHVRSIDGLDAWVRRRSDASGPEEGDENDSEPGERAT